MINGEIHTNGVVGKIFRQNNFSFSGPDTIAEQTSANHGARESGIALASPAILINDLKNKGVYFQQKYFIDDPKSFAKQIEDSKDDRAFYQAVMYSAAKAANLPILRAFDSNKLNAEINAMDVFRVAASFAQLDTLNYLREIFGNLEASEYATLIEDLKGLKAKVISSVDNKLCSSRYQDTFAQRLIDSGEVPDGDPVKVKKLWVENYDKVIERLEQLKVAVTQ